MDKIARFVLISWIAKWPPFFCEKEERYWITWEFTSCATRCSTLVGQRKRHTALWFRRFARWASSCANLLQALPIWRNSTLGILPAASRASPMVKQDTDRWVAGALRYPMTAAQSDSRMTGPAVHSAAKRRPSLQACKWPLEITVKWLWPTSKRQFLYIWKSRDEYDTLMCGRASLCNIQPLYLLLSNDCEPTIYNLFRPTSSGNSLRIKIKRRMWYPHMCISLHSARTFLHSHGTVNEDSVKINPNSHEQLQKLL